MGKRYGLRINGLSENRCLELRYFCMQYRAFLTERPESAALIERAAVLADAELYEFLIEHASTGVRYDVLRTVRGMPAGKDRFYASRRRFYRILNRMRG
ncbi:MAG: hypothetical protein LBS24_00390 [Clostridiales Family XIII bacterium]|nr:hypothetical protein [Clostridiales Family XIII bacterium]